MSEPDFKMYVMGQFDPDPRCPRCDGRVVEGFRHIPVYGTADRCWVFSTTFYRYDQKFVD